MRPRSLASTVLLLATAVAACGGGDEGPTTVDVTPVPLDLAAPTYAIASRDGLVLRSGDLARVFPEYTGAEWLPGGRALLTRGWWVRGVWDPATDEVTRVKLGDPNRSVAQISLVEPELATQGPFRLVAYDLDGQEQWQVELPTTESDNPDVERLYKSAHTIDGATFLYWYDNSEDESEAAYGILRVGPEGEDLHQVQEGTPIIAMWLAADGSALLATQRTSGDPCGGCEVTQEIIEIDPGTGETVTEWSMPDEYEDSWDVREVDKVGDRIAVRFEDTEFSEPGKGGDWNQWIEQRGTWVLDDDGWSMVEGSDEELSWWQGPVDRIVATALPRPEDPGMKGDDFTYYWEHDGERVVLSGRTHLHVKRRYYEASVPGQLLPPS